MPIKNYLYNKLNSEDILTGKLQGCCLTGTWVPEKLKTLLGPPTFQTRSPKASLKISDCDHLMNSLYHNFQ